MKIARAGFLLAGLLTFAAATTADAAVVITFENASVSGGTVSYGGALGADPLVGTDIAFDIVTVGATVLDCVGCSLDFITGNSTTEIALGGGIVRFGSGGTFVITGTITDPNAGDVVVATGTLLTGSWTGSPTAVGPGGGLMFVVGAGIDRKNPDLLAYFGILDTQFIYANTELVLEECDTNLLDGFDCNVTEADVANRAPEPGSMMLFGMALVGAGAAARRRFARK
jgi:PEP-CTERM motif